mgnify:CR=1 FL=1
MNTCNFCVGVVGLLIGQIIFGLIIIDRFSFASTNQSQIMKNDMHNHIRTFIQESTFTSFVDVNSGHQNQSKVITEFTNNYTSLLIELVAFKKFDFVIQYEISPYSYKYEYICNQTTDCYKIHYPLNLYKIMRFIIQTTSETFNVHGKYYLK